MRLGHARDPALELAEHFVAVALGGRQIIGQIDFRFRHRLDLVQRELRPILEDLQQAFDAHEIVALEGVEGFRRVVPHLGVQLAAAVGERQGKIGIARFLLAHVLVRNQERALNSLVGLKLAKIGRLH